MMLEYAYGNIYASDIPQKASFCRSYSISRSIMRPAQIIPFPGVVSIAIGNSPGFNRNDSRDDDYMQMHF